MGFGCGFPVIVELEVDDEGGVETVIAVEFEEFELFKNGLIILI
ncbi:1524_t:CDS:2 [Entrophospora sp. SA101]|nr:1524_t:CDS:2 [Entrophospora sp. SA101]